MHHRRVMRPILTSLLFLPVLLSCSARHAAAQDAPPATRPATGPGGITTPSEHLGRPLGVDFQLADWNEVSSYYRLLDQQSPSGRTILTGSELAFSSARNMRLVRIS